MAPSGNASRIVRTWQPLNAPTGETHIEDDTGQVWRVVPYRSETVTGVARGEVDWAIGIVRRLP
jgi:hypothetical protein